jgi:PDZ domain-containing protein
VDVTRLLSPRRLLATGLALLAIALVAAWVWPTQKYIILPEGAHPVAPLVQVAGAKPDRGPGGIYFVDVVVRRATLLERLFPGIRSGSTLVPASDVNVSGSESAQIHADRLDMARSQTVAAAVALRSLGLHVRTRGTGAIVAAIFPGSPAAEALHVGDVIVGVDGRRVRSRAGLRRLIGRHKPGDHVRLRVRGVDGKTRTVILQPARDPQTRRTVIGVIVNEAAEVRLPRRVRIDVGNVVGPSAGLAFALAVVEKSGRDVDRGYRVAATGALELDGTVDPIGGVKQKTIGARHSHVDLFLVPAGENAAEAKRYAHGLRIVPVDSFRQALHALATLPPKQAS